MHEEEMFAIIGTLFLLVLPFIVLIFTKHQQRMAQIIHDAQRSRKSEEALLQEIQSLRNLVTQQTILLDSVSQAQSSLTRRFEQEQEFHQRLGA